MKFSGNKNISLFMAVLFFLNPVLHTFGVAYGSDFSIFSNNNAKMPSWFPTRKETPQDFNDFLDSCNDTERVQLLQALGALKPSDMLSWFPSDYKLKDEYFGKLKGLPNSDVFTTDKKKETASKLLKPETFNDVLPETVLDAVEKGILDKSEISTEAIRKALVWRAYNKTTYVFRSDEEVDYHGIVQWVAGKTGLETRQINSLPTFSLEIKIAEKYFETLWTQLSIEQRMTILNNVEKESGKILDNKTAVASLSGAGAIAALQTFIAVNYGFALYTALSSAIYAIGSTIGVTWPFYVYTTASHWLHSFAMVPVIGWVIEGALVSLGIYMLGSSEKDTVGVFVMTVNSIKIQRYMNKK